MDRLDVVKGVSGQRVWFYPQEGRPTATPTVLIKDEYGTTVTAESTTNVTLDTVSTTLSASAAIGDVTVTLTATTDIEVGVSYLLTSTLGEKEWVRVRSVNSSTKVVTLDESLRCAYAATSTFVSTRFYRTLSTAEVASLAELYRARAVYAVSGFTYILEIPFDVVLTPLPNLLTVELVKKHRPDVMELEHSETRGTDYQDLRESAWNNVREGIREHASGWRPALVRTPEGLEKWGLAELDLLLQMNGVEVLRKWDPERAILHLETRITLAKEKALAGLAFLDKNENDVIEPETETRPLRMRFIR
jgi:hypothetical protein